MIIIDKNTNLIEIPANWMKVSDQYTLLLRGTSTLKDYSLSVVDNNDYKSLYYTFDLKVVVPIGDYEYKLIDKFDQIVSIGIISIRDERD